MFSKPLAFVLLALGCLTAAAGGAYVANRHTSTEPVAATAPAADAAATPAANPAPAQTSSKPVAETEAAVSGTPTAAPRATKADSAQVPAAKRAEPAAPKSAPAPQAAPVQRTVPMTGGAPAAQPQAEPQQASVQPPAPAPASEPATKPADVQPEPPRPAQFEEIILPAASVIGLQLETSLSSERSRLEDRVEARVSRDVMAAGRVAIPAGARVIGSVIEVDKGGKVKAPARIGIRFHTLVLADGSEVALRTEPIFRDGESPAASSAKKIGGGAIAGAILGGILGGGKGAAIGSATGAAGGTAAVMSGDRTIVSMPSGQLMTAKLSAPATITVERRE
jgi:type IV secretory pathway VirB10-like protein